MPNLTSLQKALLSRKIAQNDERIKKLERFLQGQPIGTARFADAIITAAKIAGLSADKIESGIISVGTEIIINDGTVDRILINRTEIKISKPGVDVKQVITEANKKDFVLLSTVEAHKIRFAGIITTGTHTHGVGKVPFFHCWIVNSSLNPTEFTATNDPQVSTTQITNIPNPSYLMVFNEGGNP